MNENNSIIEKDSKKNNNNNIKKHSFKENVIKLDEKINNDKKINKDFFKNNIENENENENKNEEIVDETSFILDNQLSNILNHLEKTVILKKNGVKQNLKSNYGVESRIISNKNESKSFLRKLFSGII